MIIIIWHTCKSTRPVHREARLGVKGHLWRARGGATTSKHWCSVSCVVQCYISFKKFNSETYDYYWHTCNSASTGPVHREAGLGPKEVQGY